MASSSKPSPNRSLPKASSPNASSSAPPSQAALGYVFLPSDVEIIEIGKILGKGEAKEWNDKVKRIDMYSDAPYVLLADDFPGIKLKNTHLVWTPRRLSKGSGFNRDLNCPKGGYWYPSGKIPVMDGEKVVGYFRILKFYEGGKGGIGGVVTDWCMKEFFDLEGYGNEFVICTVMFENSENTKYLKAFDEARKVLEGNATSSRGTKLETDKAISKGGKRAPQAKAKAKESVVGSVGSAIDVGTPFARRTRSQSIKLAEAIGSGITGQPKITGQKDADKKKQGTKLNRFRLKGIKGSKITLIRVQDPELPPAADVVPEEAPRVLAPRVETHAERALGRVLGVSAAERASMDSDYRMTKSRVEASGAVNDSTREVQPLVERIKGQKEVAKSTRFFLKGNKVTAVRVQDTLLPPTDVVVPEEARVVEPAVDLAAHVETHAERAVGRELSVSAAKRDPVDPEYFN